MSPKEQGLAEVNLVYIQFQKLKSCKIGLNVQIIQPSFSIIHYSFIPLKNGKSILQEIFGRVYLYIFC